MSEASYFRYWGKAGSSAGESFSYHLLPYHCLDVAAVMRGYVLRHAGLRQKLALAIGVDAGEVLLNWLAFWAALHDVGKFSEAFQRVCPDLFRELHGRLPSTANPCHLRHDSLGMLLWNEVLSEAAVSQCWFGQHTESALDGLDCWARAVTGHHGQPPENATGWTRYFTERADREAVFDFITDLRGLFLGDSDSCLPEEFDPERFLHASREISWWFAGAVVLADWLGSNADYFRYCTEGMPLSQYWELAIKRAKKVLDASGTLPVKPCREQSFGALFSAIPAPSPLQAWASAVSLAEGLAIYLFEDVTGAGKTEAAVMLAHRLMAAGHADGFFVALPTMATANAMYHRLSRVYTTLFAEHASLVLAQSQRFLVEAFVASVIPDSPPDPHSFQNDETATARCTAWLADHNKSALLAPAGVGTIDQALLAVLSSKHQSLRLLGLFRKVLIVDEVHACDPYMQGVLERLLEFHARAGGGAILLSATLPGRMKQSLLDAFARGRREQAPTLQTDSSTPYPLATRWPPNWADETCVTPITTRPDVRRCVAVRYLSELDNVISGINAALKAGKCVCWMRNTVADAIEAYSCFKGRMPDEKITLFHARFALCERLTTEEKILECFGKSSTPDLRTGRLVIATQVAEQSLDVDWDMVVSDLAPIDRLIQRAGRLQRHPRDEQGQRLAEPMAKDRRDAPCLWVFGPAWDNEPNSGWFKATFPKAAAVYPHHGQLWLTARALQSGSFTMPDDARRLIEGVFGENAEIPSGLQSNANQAEGKGFADASAALESSLKLDHGYERGGIDWWSEAKTPTRLGEISVNIVLARWEKGQLQPWAAGKNAWSYSSVRIVERLISASVVPEDANRQTAFNTALESLPGKGRWSILLPLEKVDGEWVGAALSARQDEAQRREYWMYSEKFGLCQWKAPGESPGAALQK